MCGREGWELEAHGVGEGEPLLPVVPPRGAQDGADLVELKEKENFSHTTFSYRNRPKSGLLLYGLQILRSRSDVIRKIPSSKSLTWSISEVPVMEKEIGGIKTAACGKSNHLGRGEAKILFQSEPRRVGGRR